MLVEKKKMTLLNRTSLRPKIRRVKQSPPQWGVESALFKKIKPVKRGCASCISWFPALALGAVGSTGYKLWQYIL